MTFLELVAELHRESGAGSTAPATTLSQKGEAGRLVDWIKQANLYIQNKHTDWNFLWAQGTFNTVVDTYVYQAPGDAAAYDRGTFFVDDEPVEVLDYIEVKGEVRETGTGIPYQVVLMPDKTLRLDLTPNAVFTVTFDYWANALDFIASTEADPDTTLIPERFHQAIVGKALMYYAEYEDAKEVMAKGKNKYDEWMPLLESNQLPGDRHMHSTAEGNDMVIEVD